MFAVSMACILRMNRSLSLYGETRNSEHWTPFHRIEPVVSSGPLICAQVVNVGGIDRLRIGRTSLWAAPRNLNIPGAAGFCLCLPSGR